MPSSTKTKGSKRGKDKDNLKDPKLNISKTYLCGTCEKEIIENAESKEDESIECTVCNRWFHCGCTPLTPHVFEIMSTSDNIKFFCTQCEDSKGKEKKDLKTIMDMMEKMEERLLRKMENIVDERLDLKVKDIEKKLEEKIAEKLNAISVTNIEQKIKIQVEETLDEQKEIESKSKNLIIFNLDETVGSENEKLEEDLKTVKEIKNTVSPELINEGNNINSTSLQRLGKFNPNAQKCRPLRVVLPDEAFKDSILKNAMKLRRTKKHNNIYLKSDQTKKQQLQEYQLRKERKERILNCEDVIIYNGKVILRSQHPNYDPSKQKTYVKARNNDMTETQTTA